MKKKVIEKIKLLCNQEIEFVASRTNSVVILLPYDISEIEIEIEGSTDEEQVESFIDGINQRLDDMINHLEDCKL